MRALVCREYGPVETLVVENVDDPVAGPGAVLVNVAAAGLNYPDMLMVAGRYQVRLPTPFIPGIELAGTIAAVGDGVDESRIGQRVMAATLSGAFAEKTVIPADRALPIPADLDFEQAAGFVITYGTTIHALRQSTKLQAGETLLVLGAAGGVGIAAVELGKAMGATVIAAASTDEKLAFATKAGADHVINYTRHSLRDELKPLTSDKGVDVVYDPVGGELGMDALKSLAWQGRHLVIGFASGDIPAFPANLALLKAASITGVYWGQWSEMNPRDNAANFAELAEWVAVGKLRAHVSSVHGITEFEAAFENIAKRRVLGKVVLSMR